MHEEIEYLKDKIFELKKEILLLEEEIERYPNNRGNFFKFQELEPKKKEKTILENIMNVLQTKKTMK